MFRYLTHQEVALYLNSGKTIEVSLGRISEDNEIISWLDFKKTSNNLIRVTCFEVYDEGNLEWVDLYAFSFIDPDMEFDTNEFNTLKEATNYI